MELKNCRKCGQDLPVEMFNRCGGTRRRPECSRCRWGKRKDRMSLAIKRQEALLAFEANLENKRVCNRCGHERLIGLFAYRNGPGSRRRGTCQQCREEMRRMNNEPQQYEVKPRPQPARASEAMMAEIRRENLDRMRDWHIAEYPRDPIIRAKISYNTAWMSIVKIPRMLDSRIRGFIAEPSSQCG